jgi:hypothetical protein
LPPFPKATHGPEGSGLKSWHFISDALIPLQPHLHDQYHQPKLAKEPKEPYSPQTFLKGCITVGGATAYHYTGVRKYTPRELALFQSFPYTYKFFGSNTQATKQIGNAFPPIMAEALYRTIAKTLEAFDKGFIKAEDDLSDLDGILERKGAQLSQGQTTRPQQSRNSLNGSFPNMDLLDGLFDGDDVVEMTEPQPRRRRPAAIITNATQEVIEVDSGSDDESSDTA